MNKKSGVYKIINIINNKCYIGSSVNIKERWINHRKSLKNGKHHSNILQRAYLKYGKENFLFEILEEVEPVKEKLLEKEQYFLDTLKPEYNILKIAGSCLGSKRSEEAKQKMREARLRDRDKTLALIEHLASLRRGTKLSEETCKKMSIARLNSTYIIPPKTDEQKENCRIMALKRFEGEKLENHPNAKLTWEIVNEIRENKSNLSNGDLAIKYNVQRGSIWKVLHNYSWINKEENN